MTGRERLIAAAHRNPVDRQPILLFGDQGESDGVIVGIDALNAIAPTRARLVSIQSPLSRSLNQSRTLLDLLKVDPAKGQQVIDDLALEVSREIKTALAAGADGIAYQIEGANPTVATPMQYGGFFLEVDRMLLSEAASAAHANLLWVRDQNEPYIDFVCDLPAHLFAWSPESQVSISQVKLLRAGPIAFPSLDAEVFFSGGALVSDPASKSAEVLA